MNRLHQLQQTLLQNILDNESYPDLEFVVLDYNSKDGMEEWVKANMSGYINNGRVSYYKTHEPESWNPSHSKNVAFKLASGDIICNIWADYYTGKDFAQYVNDVYNRDENVTLTPIDFYKTKKNHNPPGDVLGKVCVKKSDFLKIKGFDERMDKHGFEDYDFVNRLEMIGVKRVLIEDFEFLKYIRHDNKERYLLPTDNLHGMYVSYLSGYMSDIIFMYKDHSFERGTLIDDFTVNSEDSRYAYIPRTNHFEYTLKPPGWQKGAWEEKNGLIYFSQLGNGPFYLLKGTKEANHYLSDNETSTSFYPIADEEMISSMLVFKHFYDTRSLMEESLKNNTAIVNPGDFGKANVYKNFDADTVIFA